MSGANPITPEQLTALAELGVSKEQFTALLEGSPIAYLLPTESEPGVAILQLVPPRLRSGVVEVKDPGGGVKTFARFRGRSLRVAMAFGLTELELFGAELLNAKLEAVLIRQGFELKTDRCPDELGGGEMTILSKVFPVT